MTVWGGVWGLPTQDLGKRNAVAITREDMRKLQVLQNRVMRLMTGLEAGTSTEILCRCSNQLSVHQLVAYHSVNQAHKIFHSRKPKYHYERLFGSDQPVSKTRSRTNIDARVDFGLSLARTSFFFQSARLWNCIPISLKINPCKETFKKKTRTWVRNNIDVRPS